MRHAIRILSCGDIRHRDQESREQRPPLADYKAHHYAPERHAGEEQDFSHTAEPTPVCDDYPRNMSRDQDLPTTRLLAKRTSGPPSWGRVWVAPSRSKPRRS